MIVFYVDFNVFFSGAKRSATSSSTARTASSSTTNNQSRRVAATTGSVPLPPQLISGLSEGARLEVERLMIARGATQPPAVEPVPVEARPAEPEDGELLPNPEELDLFPSSPLPHSIEKWGRRFEEDED